MTSVKMELLPDSLIDVPESMWLEGSITTDDGSMKLRGFFSTWHIVTGWNQIDAGKTGKLKLSAQELYPPHYAEYKNFASMSIKPREFFVGLEEALPEEAVQIYPATEYPAEKQRALLRMDQGVDFTQVVVVNELVEIRNVKIAALDPEGKVRTIYGADHYSWSKGADMVLQMSFGEEIPAYFLTFDDYFNRSYTYDFQQAADGTVT